MSTTMMRYIKILRRQQRPVRFLISRVLMRSGLCNFLTYPRNGYRLRFHPTALSATLWINPQERILEERFLAACLRPGDTVIDVGANIGTISLACSCATGERGYVLAIEPHPRVFRCLEKNIALNDMGDTISAVNIAAGNHSGEAFITDTSDDTQNTVAEHAEMDTIRVPVKPLDEMVPEEPVRLLKLDAEGCEPMILDGAEAVCARTTILYSEYDPVLISARQRDPAEYLTTLRKRGFELYKRGGGSIVELSSPPTRKSMIIGIRSTDSHAGRVKAAMVDFF